MARNVFPSWGNDSLSTVSAQLGQMNKRLDEVLIAIARLGMKEHRDMSALSDQIDAVGAKVDALATELDVVKTDAEKVIGMLSQANPDVAAAITALQAIAGKVDTAAGTATTTASELEAASNTAAVTPVPPAV